MWRQITTRLGLAKEPGFVVRKLYPMLSGVGVLEEAQREVRQPTCLEKPREESAMCLWKSGTTTWQLTATR